MGRWFSLAVICACSSSDPTLPAPDDSCAGPCPQSNIKHLVVVIQENHTFDNDFGRYCTAPSFSSPSCNDGPACCEAAPDKDPSGAVPIELTDDAQALHDPNHLAACETAEMNGGAMDRYATDPCGSPENVAVGGPKTMQPYWDLASSGALADRYFQPEIGQSSANDMYFARATHIFTDNTFEPEGAFGTPCSLQSAKAASYPDPTIGDLLTQKGVPWAFYAEGYQAMADAQQAGHCPQRDPSCPGNINYSPCIFEPGDVPFEYFPTSRDNAQTMRDLASLDADLANGTLPAVVFIKGLGYHSEHPGVRTTITDGIAFVKGVLDKVTSSRYRDSTLFLLTYDEGGGYWDHVKPPPPIDATPYGTRVPMVALGPFARKGFVSHVVMDHSSIVKLIEWNFLGTIGQLKTRDALVNGLGSMLDANAAGASVP